MFVYIIDRDGELDVYESFIDAQEAQSILRRHRDPQSYPIVEQVVFAESSSDTGPGSTCEWLSQLAEDYKEEG